MSGEDALARLEAMIVEVENLKVSDVSSKKAYVKPADFDEAWKPHIPPGHTAYSWNVEPIAPKTEPIATPTVEAVETKHDEPAPAPAPKKQQKKQAKKPQKGGKAAKGPQQPVFSRLDIRVGKIVSVEKHPNADSMYLEKIDVGEAEPRQVISGLVKYYTLEEMQDTRLLVICNLKPSKLRKIDSYGMVLCAGTPDKSQVELVIPPEEARVGERVALDLDDYDVSKLTPDEQVNADKKKKNSPWNLCKDDLKTNDAGEACWQGTRFITAETRLPLKVKSLVNSQLS